MNKEEQENEILALESILDHESFKCVENSGEIQINPVFKHSTIELKVHCSSVEKVEFLPPLRLRFVLPRAYPSDKPPEYTLTCEWLSKYQLIALCEKLDEIWKSEVGSVVLFKWYQFLEDDLFNCLDITNSLEIGHQNSDVSCTNCESVSEQCEANTTTASLDPYNASKLRSYLLRYNHEKKTERFLSSSFTCNICFESKRGSRCLQSTDCSHIHCKDCLSAYFSIQIKDGSVAGLKCPEADCSSQFLPNMIQALVEPDLYNRYEKLLLQVTLDTMDDIIYCPLLHCQSPVILEKESTLAQCPRCFYAFCPFCKLLYHGVSKCKIASSEMKKICDKYRNANDEEKKNMEAKYGRKVLATAVEESMSESWMKNNTKACPACQANIQKVDGCHKMTCYKCRAYFCWLCMQILRSDNPYRHYNDPSSPCHQQLFVDVDIDDDDWWQMV